MLQPDQKKKLDTNIKMMLESGATENDVNNYAKDFVNKFEPQEKKKDVSDVASTSPSPSPTPKLVSAPKDGSLVGPKMKQFNGFTPKDIKSLKRKENEITLPTPLVIKIDKASMDAKLKNFVAKKPEVAQRLEGYTKAKFVEETFVEETKKDVEQNYKGDGIWNNILTGAKKFGNLIAYPTKVALFMGTEDPKPFFEIDDFSKEREIVNKKIAEETKLAKKEKQSTPIYDQETIDKMVKEEKIKSIVDSKKNSQVRSYLEDLDKEDLHDLNVYQNIEKASFKATEKENLKQQNILLPAYNNSNARVLELEAKHNKYGLTDAEKQEYKLEFNKRKEVVTSLLDLKDKFVANNKDIGTADENLDLFKRDYSFARHLKGLGSGILDLASGGIGFLDYGYEGVKAINDKLNLPLISETAEFGQNLLRESSIDLKEQAEDLKNKNAKSIGVDDINSLDDLGSWMMDTTTSQIPIFAMIATGAPGIAYLGSSATGQQFEKMTFENKAGTANFSQSQLLSIPAIYGGSEIGSATFDLYLFKQAARTYRAAITRQRSLIVDSMTKRMLDKGVFALKTTGIETLDEVSTQGVQNFADIYIGGDKKKRMTDGFKDVAAAGAFMGFFIGLAPAVVADATNKFSTDTKIQSVNSEIIRLQSQLDKMDVSPENKATITEQLNNAKSKSVKLLEKRVGDMLSLSNAQFTEINTIERTQANIRDKEKSIKSDAGISTEGKKQILANLKEEFNGTEQRRVDLLQRGANVQLERLEPEEVIKLKDKAARALMKEQNPDGSKNITITDEEISKRAVTIYNEEVAKQKEKERAKETENTTTQTSSPSSSEEATPSVSLPTAEQVDLSKLQNDASQSNNNQINNSSETNTSGVVKEQIPNSNQIKIDELESERAKELDANPVNLIPINLEENLSPKEIKEQEERIKVRDANEAKQKEINIKYDVQIEKLKNEAVPPTNPTSDGNVQSGTPIVEQNEGQQGSPKENVPEAVEPRASENDVEVDFEERDEFDNLLSGEAEKRRKDGKYTRDGVEFVRAEPKETPRGKESTVKFADGVEVDAEFTIMEAKDVQPSHLNGKRNPDFFITEAQPKNRKDSSSIAASDKIGKNPKLNEVGESSNAYSGAPVVNERGEVIQGNNRAEGLKKHYANKGKTYKEQLKAEAAKFGLTEEQIDSMENPVLVRKVKATDVKAIELGNYDVKDIETGGTRRIDPVATSRRIPNKVKANLMDILFKDNNDKTLNEAIRDKIDPLINIFKNYLNPAQIEGIIGKDGQPKQKGLEDLQTVVQHFLFDDGNVNLPEHFESLSAKARNGILKSLPKLFSLGTEKSIISEVQNAIGAIHSFVNSGTETFNQWLNQADMFNEDKTPTQLYSPLEIEIAKILIEAKTEKEIKTTFENYHELVNGKESDMFTEAVEGLSKKEAVEKQFKVDYNDKRAKPADKVDDSSKSKSDDAKADGKGSEGESDSNAESEGIVDSIFNQDNIKGTLDFLDDLKIDLNDLKSTIPFAPQVWNAFIEAVKLSVKAGNTIQKAILEGIDALKNNGSTQSEINDVVDFFNDKINKNANGHAETFADVENLINQGKTKEEILANYPNFKEKRQAENIYNRITSANITEDAAYTEVKDTFDKARKELDNKKTTKEYVRKAYRSFVKSFTDRQYIAKRLLDKTGLKAVKNLIINAHGASGKAKVQFKEVYDKVYKGLTSKDRANLDEIIQAIRFIAIDNARLLQGKGPVTHPNFIDKNKSEKFLSKLEKELGTEKYNDLVKRSEAYFEAYKDLLTKMKENGLITQESYDAMHSDYQPRVFLQYVIDFEGNIESSKQSNQADTGGLSAEQIKALSEGDANSLVLNSEWLLTNSILARNKAMSINNINKRFMNGAFQDAKARFEKLDPKNLKGDDVRFYKYFKELNAKVIDNPIVGFTESGKPKYSLDKTPINFQKAYYYIDGVKHEFFLEKYLHESWFDNMNHILSGNTKEFVSYASGSALLKGIATGNNPAFPIVNTPRDFLFTATFSDQYSKIVPKAMLQIGKDVVNAIKEIKKPQSDILQKYIEYGGAMDFLSSQGKLKKSSVVGKLIDKAISPNTRDVWKTKFDAITLHKYSTYSEMMFRLGIFQRSIHNQLKELGLTDISQITDKQQRDDIYNQSVSDARSILDFNQGGTVTRDMEAIIPYINVAFQGGRVAATAFEKDPVRTASRIVQVATLASSVPIGISLALISAMKGDDDKDKSVYLIYSEAMEGISLYQKMKYMNIVTGKKNEDGEYMIIKIAKAQELSPFMSITDDIYNNQIRQMAGLKEKSAMNITRSAVSTFNDNVMPLDVTSPAGLITRNPMLKATLTYTTGYDFFREEPLSMDIGKVPRAVEGITMKSTEEFYKKIGEKYGFSPVRTKAFVESLITGPSTNPFVGMLYGGANAASSDKDMKAIGKDFFESIYKSTGKRVIGYTSDFNRKLAGKKELQDKIEAIETEKYLQKTEFNKVAKQFIDKEITKSDLNSKLKELEPSDRKRLINKVREKKIFKNIEGTILDIKYERNAEVKALMISNYYGDIFDNSESSKKVLGQMNKVKGILTPEVRRELIKLKKELNKKAP